jgi:hypothetical protein
MNEPQYHRFGNPSRVRITWDWYEVIAFFLLSSMTAFKACSLVNAGSSHTEYFDPRSWMVVFKQLQRQEFINAFVKLERIKRFSLKAPSWNN